MKTKNNCIILFNSYNYHNIFSFCFIYSIGICYGNSNYYNWKWTGCDFDGNKIA